MSAYVQNTANTSTTQHAQLSSNLSSQLDNITKILNTNFACIDEDMKRFFCNQKLIYNTIQTRQLASEQ